MGSMVATLNNPVLCIWKLLKRIWETQSPAPNQGMDSETRSTAKAKLLMMVSQDRCLVGRHTRDSHSKCFYSLEHRCLPRFLTGWVLWGVQSSWRSPKFHYFLIEYPSFSLPNLHPHFSKKAFLLMYPFPQHLVCLRNIQVHELCQVCKSLTSLEPGNRQRMESYLFRIQSNLPPQS